MPDWTKSMQQTFEYYTVDPSTWYEKEKLQNVTSSSITRDSSQDTLGSATFDITGSLDNDTYIRPYLVTIQNGIRERFCLGTFLAQTPSQSFDGKVATSSIDAYTPLIELTEKYPPVGYSIFKNTSIMETAYELCREKMRAPVVKADTTKKLYADFVANTDDTWLTFLKDLIANNKQNFGFDDMYRVIFTPTQELASLQPVWTYDSSNSSILYPDVSVEHDLFSVPNVVTVIYSASDLYFTVTVKNDDPNSATSTVNRGREIEHVDTNPSVLGNPTKEMVEQYANDLLKSLSTIEYKITYKHGYCPVRLGDCVRIDYPSFGLNGIKAKVTSQSISCSTGCEVDETAVYTKRYWG